MFCFDAEQNLTKYILLDLLVSKRFWKYIIINNLPLKMYWFHESIGNQIKVGGMNVQIWSIS